MNFMKSLIHSRVNKVTKNNFNWQSRNLIYVPLCQDCKGEYIDVTGCLIKEGLKAYRQHIRQPHYQQIKEEHLRL